MRQFHYTWTGTLSNPRGPVYYPNEKDIKLAYTQKIELKFQYLDTYEHIMNAMYNSSSYWRPLFVPDEYLSPINEPINYCELYLFHKKAVKEVNKYFSKHSEVRF